MNSKQLSWQITSQDAVGFATRSGKHGMERQKLSDALQIVTTYVNQVPFRTGGIVRVNGRRLKITDVFTSTIGSGGIIIGLQSVVSYQDIGKDYSRMVKR